MSHINSIIKILFHVVHNFLYVSNFCDYKHIGFNVLEVFSYKPV